MEHTKTEAAQYAVEGRCPYCGAEATYGDSEPLDDGRMWDTCFDFCIFSHIK